MSEVFKALSDPTRRHVLTLLREGPRTAGELAAHFAVSKPTMSAHFSVLRAAGLIESVRQGKTLVYGLKLSVLEDALLGFARLFEGAAPRGAPLRVAATSPEPPPGPAPAASSPSPSSRRKEPQ